MNYYTATIPPTLAEKLKEKGMPMDCGCNLCCLVPGNGTEEYTYGFVFDWLMSEKDTEISFEHHFQSATIAGTMETSHEYYAAHISRQSGGFICCEFGDTWHEAANAAIEKALTLI